MAEQRTDQAVSGTDGRFAETREQEQPFAVERYINHLTIISRDGEKQQEIQVNSPSVLFGKNTTDKKEELDEVQAILEQLNKPNAAPIKFLGRKFRMAEEDFPKPMEYGTHDRATLATARALEMADGTRVIQMTEQPQEKDHTIAVTPIQRHDGQEALIVNRLINSWDEQEPNPAAPGKTRKIKIAAQEVKITWAPTSTLEPLLKGQQVREETLQNLGLTATELKRIR